MTTIDPTPVSANLAVSADSDRRLISAHRVQGTAVYDRNDNRLGTVEDVMIDKRSGQVAFAVMSFGGFLGLGERHHPLPWSVLTYEPRLGGYVVGLTREELEGAPHYEPSAAADLSDTEGRRVYDHYKQRPFYLDVA
ncbi:PRC-barrel domain-containing protein [Roseomonas sp. CCTCC AB2023176]|uniref:PRC-barrel domain-containing protein n=1 Tax=Roseomonas sp. CCTCC AB2023176 TaxID=3342640 RepID=UPI0035E2296B